MERPRQFVELFAGSGSVSLQLVGGRSLTPVTSWMGGKRRLAPVILKMMGLRCGLGAQGIHLNDAGPWGKIWPHLASRDRAMAVASVLRGWHDEGIPIQSLWETLKAEGPRDDEVEAIAQWLILQSRSANGTPLFWDDDNHLRYSNGHSYVEAGQKGRNSRHRSGANNGGLKVATQKTTNRAGWGGLIRIATLAERVEAIGWALNDVDLTCTSQAAEDEHPPRDAKGIFLYLDPPYKGCTGYGWDCEREHLLALAEAWARAGAVVAISEAEGLATVLGRGWGQVDITLKPGAKPEWLTCYPPPAWHPPRQIVLKFPPASIHPP